MEDVSEGERGEGGVKGMGKSEWRWEGWKWVKMSGEGMGGDEWGGDGWTVEVSEDEWEGDGWRWVGRKLVELSEKNMKVKV